MAVTFLSSIGRKGFLFTTLGILIVLAVIIFATTQERQFPRTQSQTARVHTMDQYFTNLEDDLPRAAYIAGFRGMIGMEEYISSSGLYVADFDTTFKSIFTNGTINGTTFSIMDDSTFEDFATRFRSLSARQGIVTQLDVENVSAFQTSPWFLDLNITVRVFLSDTASTASFNHTIIVNAKVPIDGVKDPLHSVGTQGRLPRPFHTPPFSGPYVSGTDVTKLALLVNQSYYIASTNAPSFRQRFTGDFSASPYGIVSLVRVVDLNAQGITVNRCRSLADYLYYGGPDTANSLVSGMPAASFWLDAGSLADFNAAGIVAGPAPCP